MKEFWNSLSPMVKMIIVIIIIIILITIIYLLYSAYDKRQKQKGLENSTAVGNTSNGVPISVNLGTKAAAIHEALHGSVFSEDEEMAIQNVTDVPKSLIPELSRIYFNVYDLNLKSDLMKYLSSDEWNSISFLFS